MNDEIVAAEQAAVDATGGLLAIDPATMNGPPFDGKPCPMCPMEMRNFSATAHNLLVRYDDLRAHPSDQASAAFHEYMRLLREALAEVQPLADAHFADRRHSHSPSDQ